MNQDIKKFIEDFKNESKYSSKKNLFSNYFLRGRFKDGFRILFDSDIYQRDKDYYFKLDSEDIDYLVNKYTPIYEDIVKQEKEKALIDTRNRIQELNDKLKQMQNGQ